MNLSLGGALFNWYHDKNFRFANNLKRATSSCFDKVIRTCIVDKCALPALSTSALLISPSFTSAKSADR